MLLAVIKADKAAADWSTDPTINTAISTAVNHQYYPTITSDGSGNGSVGFTIAANSGASRTGSLTIAGHSFTITQAGVQYTLVITKSGTGAGAVNRLYAPNFSFLMFSRLLCGTDCQVALLNYDIGTQVNLYAEPESGTTFIGWTGGGCSGTGVCTVTVNENTSINAAFAPVSTPATDNATTTIETIGSDIYVKAPIIKYVNNTNSTTTLKQLEKGYKPHLCSFYCFLVLKAYIHNPGLFRFVSGDKAPQGAGNCFVFEFPAFYLNWDDVLASVYNKVNLGPVFCPPEMYCALAIQALLMQQMVNEILENKSQLRQQGIYAETAHSEVSHAKVLEIYKRRLADLCPDIPEIRGNAVDNKGLLRIGNIVFYRLHRDAESRRKLIDIYQTSGLGCQKSYQIAEGINPLYP